MNIERIVINNLVTNEEYSRKVIPFLKEEYFESSTTKVIYNIINEYFTKYNTIPTKNALSIDLSNKSNLNEILFKDSKEYLASIEKEEQSLDWTIDVTETWCKNRAIYNALMKSISIIDDKNSKIDKGAIPQILSDAIGVSFDNSIGHDFLEDFNERFEFYHKVESRIPFDIEYLNKVTRGGLPNKTLNMILAGTGIGKTLAMCHMAAFNLMSAKNVLYITLEMAEEEISRRIDANLLDIPINELETIPKEIFDKKIERVRAKTKGKLIVKEFPTTGAGAANFRHLLNELKIKKNFVPDIIYIDYINICISSRLKISAAVNSYTLIKAIAEELRGLAVEFNLPIVSATQTNREGYCLFVETKVEEKKKREICLSELKVGDSLLSKDNEYNKVLKIFPKKTKNCYKITLESGKHIICSEDHYFPLLNGEKNIKNGLSVGEFLIVKPK